MTKTSQTSKFDTYTKANQDEIIGRKILDIY